MMIREVVFSYSMIKCFSLIGFVYGLFVFVDFSIINLHIQLDLFIGFYATLILGFVLVAVLLQQKYIRFHIQKLHKVQVGLFLCHVLV